MSVNHPWRRWRGLGGEHHYGTAVRSTTLEKSRMPSWLRLHIHDHLLATEKGVSNKLARAQCDVALFGHDDYTDKSVITASTTGV